MPEFYITDDFVTPIECLSEALGSIQGLYEEKRIEDKRNAELRILDILHRLIPSFL